MIKNIVILFAILLFVLFTFFSEKSFDEQDIYIGTSLPKTNIMSEVGNAVEKGALAYMNYANESNLIKDKKIHLISYDDKYEPEITMQNINKLIYEKNIFALFGIVGTPTVKNILPLLEEEKIPLFATFSGASFLRNQSKNFINFRSSYQEEIEKIVKYLYEKKAITKFAVFYQNDGYGEEGYIAIINSLKKRGLNLQAEGNYKRNTLSIKHAFHEMKDKEPQAIIMVGAYKANALFIQKAKKSKNLKNTIFCNISFSNPESIVKELKKDNINMDNLIFSEVVPNYLDESIPVGKEYKNNMKKYFPNEKLSFVSFESYLASKVLVNAIANIKGKITRKKLTRMLKLTQEDLLKGLELRYKNSELLNKVYLFKYKDSKFMEIKD